MTVVITSAAVLERNNAQGSDTRVRDTVSASRPLQGASLGVSSSTGFSSSAIAASSDAVSVSISRNTSRALRSLSDGASYINTAEEALEGINSLLNQLDNIASRIKNEVNPTQRDDLAAEGAEILSEIDRIASETESNDRSVFSGEPLYVSADLDGADFSSNSLVTVSVAGLSASTEKLGLGDLDSAALESDPTSARDSIDNAQSIVREQLSALDSSRAGLSQSVAAYGRRSAMSDSAAITNFSEARSTAEGIFSDMMSEMATQFRAETSRLDSQRVQTLLTTPEEPEPITENTSQSLSSEVDSE
jgi:flagellin-like hook-associated protein FlgL